MKKQLYSLCLCLFLFSCNPVRKILKGGKLRETSFVEKIPFTFDFGLPIIKVEIEGKSYNFLFDTGAPTVISPELQALLKLEPKTVGKTSDSQGNSSQQEFVKIPSMKTGNLNFENIGATVVDMNKVFEFKCMNLDGIIGANQMEKAIWQIDYRNNIITASNSISNFNIPEHSELLKFTPKKGQKTPKVMVKIGNKAINTTFDTGATTYFTFPFEYYKSEIEFLTGTEAVGSSSSGIYGTNKGAITTYKKIPKFTINNIQIANQIATFNEGSSAIIGNSFFKNYRLILDWKENQIYMIKEVEIKNATLETFGIGLRYIDNQPTIAKIFKGTDADKSGLQLGDKIIAIDDLDVSKLTETEACNYTFNNILSGKESRNITVLRAGNKLVFNLKKAIILN